MLLPSNHSSYYVVCHALLTSNSSLNLDGSCNLWCSSLVNVDVMVQFCQQYNLEIFAFALVYGMLINTLMYASQRKRLN